MMVDFFTRQFQYDHWANQRALEAISAAGKNNGKALRLFCHILAAQQVWHTRATGSYSAHLAIWPEFTVGECSQLLDEFYENWRRFINSLSPDRLPELVAYHNSKGQSFQSSIQDILNHVVMHGTYHRGQIATLLRQEGGVPVLTDFIHYTRNPQA
ncbi:MAG TPA: DinB family protein [Calditrichia bacterium]|nr:DinB family protein [Calditrichota bacterium]HQU74057.1 DinB family protein [Calditrichia bacterium]HQV30517.1 DinB family protein [Calditrichia bacterium]